MRALVSVSDKSGIADLCRELVKLGVEIVSTGGTAKVLSEHKIPYIPIEKITNRPEAFGGRMKTISFEIASALLFRRGNPQDESERAELGITPIDLVVCNLYPFSAGVKKDLSTPDLIELIDVGGPNMIRAAAKNHEHVTILSDPTDYPRFLAEYKNERKVSSALREELAIKAFALTASYDLQIQLELSKRVGTNKPQLKFSQDEVPLRYGENPHQKAFITHLNNTTQKETLASARPIQGKELSYNNYLDLDAAYKCVSELINFLPHKKSAVIIKHGNPCGVASTDTLLSAIKVAWESDPVSSFGSVIALSEKVDLSVATFLNNYFIEIIAAPDFTKEALDLFSTKKNLRVLKIHPKQIGDEEIVVRSINGALLVQDEDRPNAHNLHFELKTKNGNNLDKDLFYFGQIIIKYLKSNTLALVKQDGETLTISASGVGQPNRLECLTKLIAPKIQGKDITNTHLFSDAFFPFPDIIETAAKLGIRSIIEPGGSIKDSEVISTAEKLGIALYFTNIRNFRH